MEDLPKLKPSILVIFGITGDLAKRKVLPALYHLCQENILPESTKIIGISRREIAKTDILTTIKDCIDGEGQLADRLVIEKLASWLTMFKLEPQNDPDYDSLEAYMADLEDQAGTCLDRLYYLAIPPQVYAPIIEKLGSHGLNGSCRHNKAQTRLLIEKPFGFDVSSAKDLITKTEKVFSEDHIYRIDHYLAKETAQNILKFRRHNPVFSSQWDGAHITRIHVIAKEKIGIENRVSFYEQVGAMRDLIQSHLMQLLSLTALDIPNELTSDEVHAAKHKFLTDLIPPEARLGVNKQVIRGQYDSYKEEVSNPNSEVETFVSIVLRSNNPKWQGCIFQMTTGKALDTKETLIKVYFGSEAPNILTFRIQPNEGMDIDLLIERPGFSHNLKKVKMNFSYDAELSNVSHDAYKRVLVDAIRGDRLLFATKDEIMASWRILQPILDAWAQENSDLVIYDSGSSGPVVEHLIDCFSDKLDHNET